jgi:hypothetical protein
MRWRPACWESRRPAPRPPDKMDGRLKTVQPPLIPALLRGDVEQLVPRTLSPDRWFWFFLVALSVGGAGAYGVAIGSWRGGWQPLFTGIKLPAILLLTATGNAFLNSLLAPLLGLNIGFRQSLAAVLASFAISSLILAAAAPVVAFQIFNLPSIEAAWSARGRAFDTIQFTQVLVIAFAGISGNFRLFQLLRHLGGSTDIAQRVLIAWLAGNFLLGTQVTWILRPYFGSHALPVEFLRDHPFQGNFFETVWYSAREVVSAR